MPQETDLDQYYMRRALELAVDAGVRGEVPVAAVLVQEDRIVAEGANEVEASFSALRHAEMICLEAAPKILKRWRLHDCTLFVTLEPCAMCAAALRYSRIGRIVYGAPDIRLGGLGSFTDLSTATVFGPPPLITSGVLADESAALLREFFQKRRGQERKEDPA